MTRTTRSLAVLAATAVAVVGLTATPATAERRDTFTVREGPQVKKSYPAIPGQYAGSEQAARPTPPGCDGTFRAVCDTVPLKIIKPANLGPSDDWLATIRLNWVGQAGDDLDLYLYDNQQIAKRTDPNSSTFTLISKSATAASPETIKMVEPDLGDYNLVVVHFSGINEGYNFTGSITVEPFTPPFETVGENRPAPAGSRDDDVAVEDGSDSPAPSPIDFSADPAPGALADPPSSALPEVALLPDADLDVSTGPIQDQFAAPVIPRMGQTVAAGRAEPVPVPLLLFWFLVVPAAIVGGGSALVLRRRRTAFSFG